MEIRIDLERDACACLMDSVSVGSPLRRVFEPPQPPAVPPTARLPITKVMSIQCTEEEAVELLDLAKQHCPAAIYAIQEALRLRSISHR